MTAPAVRVLLTPRERAAILDGAVCRYCGTTDPTDVDHVLPVAQGGTNAPENLVPACKKCNYEKNNRTPEQWRVARAAKGRPWPPPAWSAYLADLVEWLAPGTVVQLAAAVAGAVDDRHQPTARLLRRLHDAHHAGLSVSLSAAVDRVAEALETEDDPPPKDPLPFEGKRFTGIGELQDRAAQYGRVLDQVAEAAILNYLSRPDVVEALVAAWWAEDRRLATARADLDTARTQLRELAEYVAAGKISAEFGARAKPGIRRRIRDLEAGVAELDAREAGLSIPAELRSLVDAGDIRERWARVPALARRWVAELLFSREFLGVVRMGKVDAAGE